MEADMRRVIGMDLHRTFGEVVIWENGRLKREGRVEIPVPRWKALGAGWIRATRW